MSEILKDGKYTTEVTLSGGSGKTTVESPAMLTVEDGKIQAEIVWSSPNYDYMKVDGKEYYPINDEGNSVFLIDIEELDSDIPIVAQTVAMSKPRLIEYTLNFDSETLKTESDFPVIVPVAVAVVIVSAVTMLILKKRKKTHENKS